MATCKSCGATILWAKTTLGKSIPVDEKPSPDGNLILTNGIVQVVPVVHGAANRFTSHFATCPHADSHRKS